MLACLLIAFSFSCLFRQKEVLLQPFFKNSLYFFTTD